MSITNPPNGATFAQPVNVPIDVDASDADGTIAKVEVWLGSIMGEDSVYPYVFSWQ